MTEAEWLTCGDPQRMLAFLRGRASPRKLRLFACACYRLLWTRFPFGSTWDALLASEEFSDGKVTRHQLQPIADRMPPACAHMAIGDAHEAATSSSSYTLRAVWEAVTAEDDFESGERHYFAATDAQCSLIRDIFGDPLRAPGFDVAWRTSTAHGLAKTAYDGRAFDRLPILADALQDAGCDDEQLLAHCRSGGPHVRGCWAVDLVLGNS